MFMHPDLNGWISPNRTGEPEELVHGDFIPTLDPKAGILLLAASSTVTETREGLLHFECKLTLRFDDYWCIETTKLLTRRVGTLRT